MTRSNRYNSSRSGIMNWLTKNDSRLIRWHQRLNKLHSNTDPTDPSPFQVIVPIISPQRREIIRVLDVDLWIVPTEIIAGFVVYQIYVGLAILGVEGTTVDLAGTSGELPMIAAKAMFGVGGASQVSNTISAHNWRTYERNRAPVASGQTMLDGGSQAATMWAVIGRLSTGVGDPGWTAWVDALFEIEYIQIMRKDKASEFFGYDNWEETHDFNYTISENYDDTEG